MYVIIEKAIGKVAGTLSEKPIGLPDIFEVAEIEGTAASVGSSAEIVDGNWVFTEPVVKENAYEPVQVYQPTNAEVAQQISDLKAELYIAGVI